MLQRQDILAQVARSNLKWLSPGIVFFTRHGSHAYGTNGPTSDEDFKGFVTAPLEYYFGYNKHFEQAVWSKPDDDCVLYDIRKFFALAEECNPSIIEVLFTDPSDWVQYTNTFKDKLLPNRDAFLSRKARHTFSGYATSQLRRIEGHYRWLKSPPAAPPTRGEYGLPERTVIPSDQLEAARSMIEKRISSWGVDLKDLGEAERIHLQGRIADTLAELVGGDDKVFHQTGRNLGFSDNFLELLDKERAYRGRQREWSQYQHWKANRNPDRAALEEKWGYDTKHAMHLVRLMRMCREILSTGKVLVKRPDAQELLDIRGGAWDYYKLVEWAKKQDEEMSAVEAASPLPRAPDHNLLDRICVDIIWSREGD